MLAYVGVFPTMSFTKADISFSSGASVLYKAEKTHSIVHFTGLLSWHEGYFKGYNVTPGTHLFNYCYKPSEHGFSHIQKTSQGLEKGDNKMQVMKLMWNN